MMAEFNKLPEGYEGDQNRKTDFASALKKLEYDTANLIALAEAISRERGIAVSPESLITRADDDVNALRKQIGIMLKASPEKATPEVDAILEAQKPDEVSAQEAGPDKKLMPKQKWFAKLEARFDALPQLHDGIQWEDVERSLKADPEAVKKLRALDKKGHAMNVFGEEDGEFIFVSAWDNYRQVSADHRNIAYDPEGQKIAERQGYKLSGNAISIIAKIIGVPEEIADNYLADPKFHEQLRQLVVLEGWSWLKTEAGTREAGDAFAGYRNGFRACNAADCNDSSSFRVELGVKKILCAKF